MSMKRHKRHPEDERFAPLARLGIVGSVGVAPRPHDGRPAPPPVKPAPGESDQDLFRKSLLGVTPLVDDNRAEISRPRPAAQPRPRAIEPAGAPSPPPSSPEAQLLAAYRDVTPIKDSGRADLTGAAHLKPEAEAPRLWREDERLPKDGIDLFHLAVRGASPLPDTGRLHLAPDPPPALPRQRVLNDQEVLRESLEAPISFEDRLDMGDEVAFLRPGLPRRVLTDLRRGRWVVQSQLDLHGMTRDEARAALAAFLAASLRDGQRCLRLIHGKGLGSPGGEPVLKHLSRNWLAQREEILAFCQARPHDGGAGALLILLKAGHAGHRAR